MAISVGVAQPKLAGGAYWIGANGNVYYKTDAGVQDMGAAKGTSTTANLTLNGAREIADPNVGGTPRPAAAPAPAPTTKAPVLNQAAVDATYKAVDSLGVEQSVGNRNIDENLSSVMGRYGNEAARAEGDYNESTVTNNQNLQRNKQNALQAASQGRRGLRGALSSIGALGGDGSEISDRVVTQAANADLGEASETANNNQVGLDKSIGNFREDDEERRREAETAARNQRTALEGSIAGKRQSYYQKLAELFGAGGDTNGANTWLGRAGGLNNEIASKTAVAATPITARDASFNPGEMQSFAAGTGDMTVGVAAGDQAMGGSTLVAGRQRDRERERQALMV